MTKYRLVKITRDNDTIYYSIQKRMLFWWIEVDYEFSEEHALNIFNKLAISSKIEVLKEV